MRALSKGRIFRRTLYYSAYYNHAESHIAGKQGIKKALAHDILITTKCHHVAHFMPHFRLWHTICIKVSELINIDKNKKIYNYGKDYRN